MGFVILKSTNPNLSFIIKKNPSTSPHIKNVRKGLGIGWFNKSDYVIRFVDIEEKVSFSRNRDDDYDYLPYMQYCAPILMTVLIKDLLTSALNQPNELDVIDDETLSSFEMPIVKLNSKGTKMVEKLNTFIDDFKIKLEPLKVDYMFRMIVSTKKTICHLLQYCYFLGYVLNFTSFGGIEKPLDGALDKVVGIMNNLNIDYYIRYIFKTYMIVRKDFDKIKKNLETIKGHTVSMKPGTTQEQRFDFILKHVLDFCNTYDTYKIDIVDIGCGEGYYVQNLLLKLSSKYKGYDKLQYNAYDIVSEELDKIEKMKKIDSIYDKVIIHRSYDDMISALAERKSKKLIIMSEVIEHIPHLESVDYVGKIMKDITLNKIILTTPSVEFNIHYLLDGKFRHDDHKQEYTRKEFLDFVEESSKLSNKNNLSSTYHQIGDVIDDVSMSQGIIIIDKDDPSSGKIDDDVKLNEIKDDNIDIKEHKLSDVEAKRLIFLKKHKINFISGTIAPAPSNKRGLAENISRNLEDLKIGLRVLLESYDNDFNLSIQPKYMGSRCNMYLFNNENYKKLSYCTTRNGFICDVPQIVMEPLYEMMYLRLKPFMDRNRVKLIILDGELLPWSLMGKSLIDNEFMPVDIGVETEISLLKTYNFDSLSAKIDAKYAIHSIEILEALYKVYHEQMKLYAKDEKIDYKAFAILKVCRFDGIEFIPSKDLGLSQSEEYAIVHDKYNPNDAQLKIHITTENFEDSYLKVKEHFDRLCFEKGFEGIILKPDFVKDGKMPMMKVRNPAYLSIIYGYDYTTEPKFTRLVNNKVTSNKIKQSVIEYNLGKKMLEVRYDEIMTSKEYDRIMAKFLFNEILGSKHDPRL